jgi:hypothetical protein
MKLAHVKIAIAAGLVISGLFLFQQDHKGFELVMVIAGTIYLYIRWHSYKRDRYQKRMKN